MREESRTALLYPALAAGALSVIYLIIAPQTGDHAAQEFRSGLVDLDGPVIWNNWWLGGHHLPTYSVFFPWLGSWFGYRVVGVFSVLVSVILFALILRHRWGESNPTRVLWSSVWFGIGASASLFTGRLTFALGLALALLAVFLIQRGNSKLAIAVAATVALASPVAALFLSCVGLSQWLAAGYGFGRADRRGVDIAVAALLPAILLALLFPGGGDFPYPISSFLPTLVLALAGFFLIPPEERLVRTGFLVYAAALILAFVVPTSMGANANRLGALLLGPLLLCTAWPKRRMPLLILIPVILIWQLVPVERDLRLATSDPAVEAGYYRPLINWFNRQDAPQVARVEVLPLSTHWESAFLPGSLPLARGWERQADRSFNELFYGGSLSPGRYRSWLDQLGVRFVALSSADLDYAADNEAELVRERPDFLQEAFRSPDWIVYRVRNPRPMVDPPATLTDLGTDTFTVRSPRRGSFRVAIRWTPYWRVEAGQGCVLEGPDGFTEVTFDRPGQIEVGAAFRPFARLDGSPRCFP